MKKILFILVSILLLFSCGRHDHRVIDDEYLVTSVKYFNQNDYHTKYYIEATSLNSSANSLTFNGNKMEYYTNQFYSVGDTIRLSNTKKIRYEKL